MYIKPSITKNSIELAKGQVNLELRMQDLECRSEKVSLSILTVYGKIHPGISKPFKEKYHVQSHLFTA